MHPFRSLPARWLALSATLLVVVSARTLGLPQEDLHRSLRATEQRTAAEPRNAEAWIEHARVLRRMAEDPGRVFGEPEILFEESCGSFRRALDLDPARSSVLEEALDVASLASRWEEARALAERLLGERLAATGEVSPALVGKLARAVARAALAGTEVDLRSRLARLEDAEWTLQGAHRLAPSEPVVALAWAELANRAGVPDRAFAILADALRASPGSVELHQALIDLCVAEAVIERLGDLYGDLAPAHGSDAVVRFYRTYVEVLLGELALQELRWIDGGEAMVRAQQGFAFVRELEPAYAEGVRRMLARARIDEGWSLLGSGCTQCLDEVMALFLEVLERDGDLRSEPNGMGRTLLDYLGMLGVRLEEEGEYAKGVALLERVVAVHSDDAQWWNNLGYFCREKATRIETGEIAVEGAREAVARAVYERSWQAYQRATELAPDDARIVNDGALIQVYHLRMDLPIAQTLLNHAVASGERQLAELGPNALEEERFPIAQAVGDAYQNLGYLYYHLLGEPQKSREYFRLSIATESGDRSEMQAYVDAIDGKRDPIPERRAAALQRPREERREERGALSWERSLADALARARAENRIVLVYHRGAGLGLTVAFLDQLVKQRTTAERFASAVPVAADLARHASLDYRTDGRRIACPHYGTITCGEHVRAALEFTAWWKERHEGRSPGETEESIFLLMPDGEPASLGGEGLQALFSDRLPELQRRIGEPRPPVDLFALGKRLRRGSLLEDLHAAEELVATPGTEAELLIEQALFDTGLDEIIRETS